MSTVARDTAVPNLAPHSFFTVACVAPPIVQFTSVGRKDSLRNIEETGEFTVNLAPEELFEQINATATDFPPEVDEFEAVGLDREASLRVKPRASRPPGRPGVRAAQHRVPGDCTVVFGRVVHAAVDERVMVDGHPEVGRLRPLARLGRDEWATTGEVLEISRIRYEDWRGADGRG
ncbi:flavin reductase family protein [Streptomyces sp. M19]